MNFLNFLSANWDSILAALVIIVVAIIGVIKQEKNIVFKMLFSLVTEAEKQYGGGTGELKLSSVISQIYGKLPSISKLIPVKTLEKWVDKGLIDAKKKWESNSKVATYIIPTDSIE